VKAGSCLVASVQLDCTGSKREIEERVRRMVKEAAGKGARIICLPEHWIPGRRANLEDELPFFAEIARETRTYVISGADYSTKGRTTATVESVILGPEGEVGRQQKVHLFANEKKRATPGDAYSIFELDGVKVGITICHDLVYPEVARILALKGAEIIFAPAKISAAGLEPWQLYVKARALENRIPIVSPNFLRPPKFPGVSLIVGFSVKPDEGVVYARVLASADSEPKVLVVDLDLKLMKRYSRERLQARRPETYSDLLKKH
jgi:predicted amidohydrolase